MLCCSYLKSFVAMLLNGCLPARSWADLKALQYWDFLFSVWPVRTTLHTGKCKIVCSEGIAAISWQRCALPFLGQRRDAF